MRYEMIRVLALLAACLLFVLIPGSAWADSDSDSGRKAEPKTVIVVNDIQFDPLDQVFYIIENKKMALIAS